MGVSVENLNVGQWVAIVDRHEDDDESVFYDADEAYMQFGFYAPRRQSTSPAPALGQPLKIIGISIPFLAVTDGRNRFCLDTRVCGLTVLHRTYVRSMMMQNTPAPYSGMPDYTPYGVPGLGESQLYLGNQQPKAKQKSQGRYGLCPRCGDKLIQLRRESGWLLKCRECGFEGGNPEKQT